MGIYTRGGAPVEFVARYSGHDNGGGYVLYKAKIAGTYPDGSGAADVGRILHADDKTARGWSCIADFVADEGWKEIEPAVKNLPEETPDNAGKIMNYFWPMVFDRAGNRKKGKNGHGQ